MPNFLRISWALGYVSVSGGGGLFGTENAFCAQAAYAR